VAESMRLFILNPGLLHIIAPERCKYIVKSGLKPVVTEDWDKVLENAPAEYSRQILKKKLSWFSLLNPEKVLCLYCQNENKSNTKNLRS
jgi:hypothetical protein